MKCNWARPCLELWPSTLGRFENSARLLFACGAIFCLFFGWAPFLVYGILHLGVAVLILGSAALTLLTLYLPLIKEKLPARRFRRLFACGCALFIGAAAVYLSFGIWYRSFCALHAPPAEGPPVTVVVLGGGIDGDQPKLMLSRRLRTAYSFLSVRPGTPCVVSGGVGRGERFSEGYVMKKYLTELGAEETLLFTEEESFNTRQNIVNSAAILEEHGLPRTVVVATDAFHQPRAAYFCRQSGLSPYALSSVTPWGLVPSSEIREMASWVKALLGM